MFYNQEGVFFSKDRYRVDSMAETGWTLIRLIGFYMTLAWYFDNVIPQNRGVPKPWYFFMQISFWFPSCKGASTSAQNASELL